VSDRIRIDGLLVRAVVGVFDWERDAPRDVRLDLVVETDLTRAGATDHLADTVDYGILAQQVHDRVLALEAKLLERVAAAAAEICLAHPRVTAVEVTVHKPGAIESAESVGVWIRRERR
jgi:FolB domain-containing protein